MIKDYIIESITPTAIVVTYANLANGDEGKPLALLGYTLSSWQASGVKGTGGTVAFLQANSQLNPVWEQLYSTTTIPQTSTGQLYLFNGAFKPSIIGGDGSTDITLSFVFAPMNLNINKSI